MTIKDVLTDCRVLESGVDVQLRCFNVEDNDILFGYATFDGNFFIDDEGAVYSLDMYVEDYKFDANDPQYEHGLITLWFGCDFLED